MQPALHQAKRAAALSVTRLMLSQFRNYRSATLLLEAGQSAILVGPNGAGKTNILEAVSLLTPGRGIRRAAMADLDNADAPGQWAVAGEVSGPVGEAQLGTGRDPAEGLESDKRLVRVNGKNAKGQAELARHFSAIWLTPQMDTLFIEGNTARRKFLDRLVYSFDPDHASRVNAYEFAMRERNKLLAIGRADAGWLSALEQKMAEQGVAMAAARRHAVDGLMHAMGEATGAFPAANVGMKGRVDEMLQDGSALMAEEKLRELLAAGRRQDEAAGRALEGPHRSEVQVTHRLKGMIAERCSTGEQKALLVSIVLAHAAAASAWHGRVPALLLDEVSTHLDETRRQALYAALAETGAQCWLTGTDRDQFTGFDGRMFSVEAGRVAD